MYRKSSTTSTSCLNLIQASSSRRIDTTTDENDKNIPNEPSPKEKNGVDIESVLKSAINENIEDDTIFQQAKIRVKQLASESITSLTEVDKLFQPQWKTEQKVVDDNDEDKEEVEEEDDNSEAIVDYEDDGREFETDIDDEEGEEAEDEPGNLEQSSKAIDIRINRISTSSFTEDDLENLASLDLSTSLSAFQSNVSSNQSLLPEPVKLRNSRKQFQTNSAPLYRWSEGMLPSLISLSNIAQQQGLKSSGRGKGKLLCRQSRLNPKDEGQRRTLVHSITINNGDIQDDSDLDNGDIEDTEEFSLEKRVMLEPGGFPQTSASIPQINVKSQRQALKSPWIADRLKHLAKAYNDRGTIVKEAIEKLPDKSEDEDEEDKETSGDELNKEKSDKLKTAIPKVFDPKELFADEWFDHNKLPATTDIFSGGGPIVSLKLLFYRIKYELLGVFEPQSATNITWQLVLSVAFLYNAIYIPYRTIFQQERESGTRLFFYFDIVADLIYLLDIVWFKTKLKYVELGQWIDDPVLTRRHYLYSSQFLYDILSVFPFDLVLYLYSQDQSLRYPAFHRLARFNRLLKIENLWEFFMRVDALTNNPYLFRIVHTLLYKLYVIHLGSCSYYLTSWYLGFGSSPWTYNNQGSAYLRCFYFSFRTATSIGGRMPKPSNDFERVYMMFAWLLGVFVFSMVIGQIRDIVATASRNEDYYQDVLNKIANYMRALNVPQYLQKRVRFWLSVTWKDQATFNENEILEVLPLKIRTDISLSVHYMTLSQVELFNDIDRSVLRDLVLKLKPILFLPGDYICRKGDIGHEMYIVTKGKIQVMGGENGKQVLVTLSEGSVFGEISILGLEGYTRRTADVRSAGYTQLFSLSKAGLWDTLKNYPEYESVLKKKVQKMLRNKIREEKRRKKEAEAAKAAQQKETQQDQEREDEEEEEEGGLVAGVKVESIIKERPKTPKLFTAVMGIVRQDSALKHEFTRSVSISSNQNNPCNKDDQDSEASDD